MKGTSRVTPGSSASSSSVPPFLALVRNPSTPKQHRLPIPRAVVYPKCCLTVCVTMGNGERRKADANEKGKEKDEWELDKMTQIGFMK